MTQTKTKTMMFPGSASRIRARVERLAAIRCTTISEEGKQGWVEALVHLTHEEIDRGFVEVARRVKYWPTPAEVIEFGCLQQREEESLRGQLRAEAFLERKGFEWAPGDTNDVRCRTCGWQVHASPALINSHRRDCPKSPAQK